jgi:hypothetical protein
LLARWIGTPLAGVGRAGRGTLIAICLLIVVKRPLLLRCGNAGF